MYKKLFASYLLLITLSYGVIMPPNAGPDEMHHARTSWYLYENPDQVFSDENFVQYVFPKSLLIDLPLRDTKDICNPQSQSKTSHCWKEPSSDVKSARSMILYYSPSYYMVIGFFQHQLSFLSPVTSGRIGSFLLVALIVALSLRILYKVVEPKKILAMCWVFTPPVVFLAASINPSSFEISTAFLVMCILIYAKKTQHISKKMNMFGYLSQIIFVLSRPSSFIWLFFILLFMFWDTPKRFQIKNYLVVPFGLLANLTLNNRSWKLNYNSTEFTPNLEFYLEESIRMLVNSGTWIFTMFGHLGWTEISMPLILFVLNISIFSYLLACDFVDQSSSRRFILFIIFGSLVVPFFIALPYSGNWPMWWSGRYSLPYFVAMMSFAISFTSRAILPLYFLGTFNLFVMLIITFWRYNWGLYSTNTPIIANGIQLPTERIIVFVILASAWLSVASFIALKAARERTNGKV